MAIKSLEKDENGQARFFGCSNIRDYEFLDKLGEGTFGWVWRRCHR
jgi:serine/threonine-protein kinase BUR1